MFADDFVVEYFRVAAGQFPGFEERGPVDVLAQFFQRVVVVHGDAPVFRHRRGVVVPVEGDFVGACVLQREPFGLALFTGVHGAHFFVFGLDLFDVGRLVVFAEQVLGDTHGARGVFHVDGGAVVAGFDFYGGVYA